MMKITFIHEEDGRLRVVFTFQHVYCRHPHDNGVLECFHRTEFVILFAARVDRTDMIYYFSDKIEEEYTNIISGFFYIELLDD